MDADCPECALPIPYSLEDVANEAGGAPPWKSTKSIASIHLALVAWVGLAMIGIEGIRRFAQFRRWEGPVACGLGIALLASYFTAIASLVHILQIRGYRRYRAAWLIAWSIGLAVLVAGWRTFLLAISLDD